MGKMERSSSRTCRWSRWGLGWPVAGCPRAPAAGGGPVPWLRHSGEGEAAWLGLGAPLVRGEAVPGVDWSCGRAEVGARRGAGGRRRSEPRRRHSGGPGRRRAGRGAAPWREETRCGVYSGGKVPEVGARLGKMESSSSRTCRWSRWGLGWPVAGCPRAPAAGGGPVSRLRHTGEGKEAWLG